MGDFNFRIADLLVSDPILLWLFNRGWEDPTWGQAVANQLTLALALHQLAGRFSDAGTREAIQGAANRAVAALAQRLVAGGVAGQA
jgi:hypothetical protein